VVAVDLETGSFRMIHELGYTALTVVEAAYDPNIQAMYLLLNGNTLRAVKVGNTTVVGGDVAVDISGRFLLSKSKLTTLCHPRQSQGGDFGSSKAL
jgi:hypothetical protein